MVARCWCHMPHTECKRDRHDVLLLLSAGGIQVPPLLLWLAQQGLTT